MISIYILINIIFILLSFNFYKAKINPISIYSIIWVTMVTLYEIKLVYYYDLTLSTWMVIITFQFAYNLGCYFGINRKKIKKNVLESLRPYNNEEKDLKRVIVLFSAISLLGVIPNFITIVKLYGFNLFEHTNDIYINRIHGGLDSGVIYLDVLAYVAVIFSGIYIQKFRFRWYITFPIFVIILNSITSGGRLGFTMGFLLLIFPLLFVKNTKVSRKIKKKKSSKIQKLRKIFLVSTLVVSVVIITNNRAVGVNKYYYFMSPSMIKLVSYNPAIYKIYTYFTSPLGVLNEFLKNPTYNFGGHTFLTIYNFFNKFGVGITTHQYQTFYNIPISVNVGTYIRELIEDFTLIPAVLMTFFLGIVFSYNYSKLKVYYSYINIVWASSFAFIICLSFFMWQIRSSSTWIILIVGTIAGYILDRKRIARRRQEVEQ